MRFKVTSFEFQFFSVTYNVKHFHWLVIEAEPNLDAKNWSTLGQNIPPYLLTAFKFITLHYS